MLDTLSIPVLTLIFVAAVGVVWVAGVWLSDSTDIISSRFHLGQALGGIILLAIGTNLPEIAITASAALHHNIGIAIGNLLGGIAIQTVVLVALDAAGKGKRPLTFKAALSRPCPATCAMRRSSVMRRRESWDSERVELRLFFARARSRCFDLLCAAQG